MTTIFCAVCDRDHTTDPGLVLARWQDQDICTDCLETRPGKEEAEAEARGERQPMTQDAYRQQGGGACPRCHSGNFDAGQMTDESGIASQRMHCLDCLLWWHALYRLAGYVRYENTPGSDADWEAFLDTRIA